MLSGININVPTIPYLPKPVSFIFDAETRILFKSMHIQSVRQLLPSVYLLFTKDERNLLKVCIKNESGNNMRWGWEGQC